MLGASIEQSKDIQSLSQLIADFRAVGMVCIADSGLKKKLSVQISRKVE